MLTSTVAPSRDGARSGALAAVEMPRPLAFRAHLARALPILLKPRRHAAVVKGGAVEAKVLSSTARRPVAMATWPYVQAAALTRAGLKGRRHAGPLPFTTVRKAVPVLTERQEVVAPRLRNRGPVRVVKTGPIAASQRPPTPVLTGLGLASFTGWGAPARLA